MKLSRIRRVLYRSGSVLGDIEAASSGSPKRIIQRQQNKLIWRGFGRLFRFLTKGK